MVQGDKSPLAKSDEGEEIDRIMKEIEDLEKKMDTSPEEEAQPAPTEATAAPSAPEPREAHAPEEDNKVVPMRPNFNAHDSLAETDAVPARDEPLMRSSETPGDGGLALKIGGCAEVSLEFTRSGITVSLECSDDGLKIKTDQGAEFRIPFKRTA